MDYYRRKGFLFLITGIFVFVSVLGIMGGFTIIYAKKRREAQEEKRAKGVSVYGALRVEEGRLYGKENEPVVLRGASSHGISWYPRYLNGEAMKTLAGYGANLHRLSMYPEGESGYVNSPRENMDYLYMGIESARSADMYIIVDWHILRDHNPLIYADEAEAFFDELSRHYQDAPDIIYEICNEPNQDTSWEDVYEYAMRMIPVIRKNAPNALILVGTPDFCTDFEGPMKKPLDYPNIMYTLHRYVDASEEKPCDIDLIRKVTQTGLPVFVSEWGIELGEEEFSPDKKIYPENARPLLDYMDEQKISWAAWALSNKEEVHSILRSDCEKYGGWIQEDMSDFGKFFFEELKKNKERKK